MTVETLPFDSAWYLESEEDIAPYLQAVLEEEDPALLCHALGQVARAKGMSQLARETGLAREALYRARCRPPGIGQDGGEARSPTSGRRNRSQHNQQRISLDHSGESVLSRPERRSLLARLLGGLGRG